MESTDRVGVLQTHNQKGENCGVIIRFSDLDEGVRDLINQYIPLLERCITLTDELRRVRDLTILTPEDIKLIDELLGDDDKGEKWALRILRGHAVSAGTGKLFMTRRPANVCGHGQMKMGSCNSVIARSIGSWQKR